MGNRQSFTDDQGSQSYSYAASSNRLTDVAGATRTRDAVGNLTNTNGSTFSYSDQNRLSGVNGIAGTIEYGHNALGQRVSKTANGTTRHYLFDQQGQLIGEANSDGAEAVEYAYLNGQPLTMWRTTTEEPSVPAVPTLVAPLDEIDTATPTFLWQPSEYATRYRLQVYDRVSKQTVHLQTHEATEVCTGNSCSLTPDIDLNAGNNHFWRVRAFGSAGWSAWSTVTRIDFPAPVPVIPTLVAPLDEIDTATPTFIWQSSEHATRYRVQVYDRVAGQTVYLQNHEVTEVCIGNSCSLTPAITLNAGNNHFWRVRAYSSGGWSAWSAVTRIDFPAPVPVVPTVFAPLLTVETATPTFIWQPSEHATRYRVQVYDRVAGQTVHLQNHEVTEVCTDGSCSLTPAISLNAGNNHFWRVRAYSSGGWSAWSAVARFDFTEGTGGNTALTLDLPVSGTVAAGEYQHFTVAAVDNARSVSIALSGLGDDADLYVRFDQAADKDNFDCKSDQGGTTDEVCFVSQEVGEVLHIAVHGFAATPFTLVAGGQ